MREQRLVVHSFLGLLKGLLNGCFHPVAVIQSRPHIGILQLLLDILPNLTVFQVRIELDYLHSLLFSWGKVVEIETNAVERSENG